MSVGEEPISETRLRVLEMTIAALVAQQPQPVLEELVGVLTFAAAASEELEGLLPVDLENEASEARYWAQQMLSRIMIARKPGRGDALPEQD